MSSFAQTLADRVEGYIALRRCRKQPNAIAMKDRSPFGIAGIWENWKNQEGEWCVHSRF
jgi:putative SOS response-associated peptidase YedK